MVDIIGVQYLEEDNIRSYLIWKLLGVLKRIIEFLKKKVENWWILKILILLNYFKIVVIKIGIGILIRIKSYFDNNFFNIKQFLLYK